MLFHESGSLDTLCLKQQTTQYRWYALYNFNQIYSLNFFSKQINTRKCLYNCVLFGTRAIRVFVKTTRQMDKE